MSDEDDVVAAARERAAAMAGKDEAALRRLLHPAFGWVSHKGDRFDLDSYLDSNRRGPNRWYGQELRDPTVIVVGGTAVLRCVVVDTVDVGGGGPERFVMPMTQTWVRTAAGWRCLGGHAGPRLADEGAATGSTGPAPVRYGVFLLPDAATSAAVVGVTAVLRAQYGLVSAQRFPPHVTVAGSLPLAGGEDDLLRAVGAVADRHPVVAMHNAGVSRLGGSVVYDVHHDDRRRPNTALVALVADVVAAVTPLLRDAAEVEGLAADVRGPEQWRGHLSLASHELRDRAEFAEEVEAFVRALDAPCPGTWRAARLAVYRLTHPSWDGPWWTDFRWEHRRSFPLGG